MTLKELAVSGVDPRPIKNPNRFWDFVPRDEKYDDGKLHLAPVKSYRPNAYGLYDMIGNAAEWTRSEYRPYPWKEGDGRNEGWTPVFPVRCAAVPGMTVPGGPRPPGAGDIPAGVRCTTWGSG